MIDTIFLLINIFLLESMLSVDNAAVLAIMVKDLPAKQQPKALRYGIFGAFFFRGICLFAATWVVKIWWLKIIGGAYLIYLMIAHFRPSEESAAKKIFNPTTFWTTVLLVEVMDMAFSIDNIFAAAAFTNNLYLILAGVFLGIIAMRFVAQWFALLIKSIPDLETSAFVVIGLLGTKLVLTGVFKILSPEAEINKILISHDTEIWFSAALLLLFFLPVVHNKLWVSD